MNNSIITRQAAPVSICDIRKDPDTYPRLHSYTPEQATAEMTKVVTKAYLYKGQTVDSAAIAATASALVDELVNEETYGLRYITFKEIDFAIRKGILTNPDIKAVSVSSLFQILLNYAKNEGREAEEQVRKEERKARVEAFRNTSASAMIDAFASKFANTHTV